ncbi:MAG: hypothetical protein PVF45_08445 [Anaerolineae bacterium]|jgi:hypothetical protein
MPRLVKGGKWTFGWVVIAPRGRLTIPPEAWCEFGFRAGGEAVFTPGSRRSGGFGVSTPALMGAVSAKLGGGAMRELAQGQFGDGQVCVPPQVGARPGDRLLTVRGSRYGLGFVARGPIYEEALKHPDLQIFA